MLSPHKKIIEEKISVDMEMSLFETLLQKYKLKSTPQRLELAKWVFKVHEHFTIDEMIYSFAEKKVKVSVATAYRFLQIMKDLNLLIEHDFGTGQKYYEHTTNHPHHEHIICNDCYKIIEFENQELEQLKNDIALEHGFKMRSHSLIIKADCIKENCTYKKNRDKNEY